MTAMKLVSEDDLNKLLFMAERYAHNDRMEWGNTIESLETDAMLARVAAAPAADGEVVYQQRTFGNRHETWRDIPKHEYDQLVLPSNGRIVYTTPQASGEWLPIESAPISPLVGDGRQRLLLWVDGHGYAFGHVCSDGDGGIDPRAEGFEIGRAHV